MFEEVQAQLVVPQKSKWGAKEFPYKQFLKCYSCGSSIVGEEKIKQFKNGDNRRYVYYHCSRQVDYDCNEPFASEATIVTALTNLGDELISNLSKVESGLAVAIEKFAKVVALTDDTHAKSNITKTYIRYVFNDSTLFEKTRLVRNLQVDLLLHERKLINASCRPDPWRRKMTQQV